MLLQTAAHYKLHQGENSQGETEQMRQAYHLIVAFNEQGNNREKGSFEAAKAAFNVILLPICLHNLHQ